MVNTTTPDRFRSLRIPLVLLLMLAVVLFAAGQDLGHWREFIRQSGWPGLIVVVLIFGLIGASPIPPEPLTLFLSVTYNPFVATIVAGLGNLLAALIEYVIGRLLGDIADMENRRQNLPFGLGKLPLDSPIFLIGTRLIPLYAPKVVSLACGAYHVPLGRFLWTTAVVTFSGAAILAYGGHELLNLH